MTLSPSHDEFNDNVSLSSSPNPGIPNYPTVTRLTGGYQFEVEDSNEKSAEKPNLPPGILNIIAKDQTTCFSKSAEQVPSTSKNVTRYKRRSSRSMSTSSRTTERRSRDSDFEKHSKRTHKSKKPTSRRSSHNYEYTERSGRSRERRRFPSKRRYSISPSNVSVYSFKSNSSKRRKRTKRKKNRAEKQRRAYSKDTRSKERLRKAPVLIENHSLSPIENTYKTVRTVKRSEKRNTDIIVGSPISSNENENGFREEEFNEGTENKVTGVSKT